MREPLKDRVRLEHIQTAINNIFQYTEGKTIQQLNDDTMLFYATVKNIEIIGEAAYHLTRAFCKGHPQTPWNAVMRMRNILVHDYYKIRLHEVWKVITEDLLPLREQVDGYLGRVGKERSGYCRISRTQEYRSDGSTHEKRWYGCTSDFPLYRSGC